MKKQCAWCNKSLGVCEPLEDKGTTHGICPSCYRREMLKLERAHTPQPAENMKGKECPFAGRIGRPTPNPCQEGICSSCTIAEDFYTGKPQPQDYGRAK